MKVSVLLCVKNGEKYIKDTIDSILNQTYQNFEFIIVVNCSTDKTLEIVSSYKDKRIRIFKTNIGQLSFNLNYGLNISEGEYVARIDADDIAEKSRLEKQIKCIENYGYDIVGSNIAYINEKNEILKSVSYPEMNDEIRRGILYKAVLVHPSIMFRKGLVLENSGYLGGRYAQDYDLWLRLMRDKKVKFYNIQEPLLKYRIHLEQAKGNKSSYGEVAGYFLKEVIYTKRFIYLFSSLIYFFKGMFR